MLLRKAGANVLHQRSPAGVLPIKHGSVAQGGRDGVIALTVRLAGPKVNPFAFGEINAALGLLRLPDRRYQHVGAQQILELFRVAAGIILVVQEEGTLNRNSGFGARRFMQSSSS